MSMGGLQWIKGANCFAIAHQIKIGYFLTSKTLKGNVYKVTLFDYSMNEVVKNCPQRIQTLH
jgi:hypothetical protein